jgi:hypothetical protein
MANYYVRAIGVNQYAGGTDKWLKIRDIWAENDYYVIKVKIRDMTMLANVGIHGARNFIFATGWPPYQITWGAVLEGLKPIRIGRHGIKYSNGGSK